MGSRVNTLYRQTASPQHSTMGVGGNETKTEKCQILPGGFAGTGPNGSFFETPGWVDKEKAPGMTSQSPVVAPPGWWVKLVTGKFLFFSPYDYEAAKSLTNFNWIFKRFLVNFSITFGF